MVAKRVIVPYTGNPATFTVPADFSTFTRLRLLGGGCCGSPGFKGAVDNEELRLPFVPGSTFGNAEWAGPSAWYIEKTSAPAVAFAPGQVLQCHIAQTSAPIADLQTWANTLFGGAPPLCISDDTWLKDNGGNVFARAPGGDSTSAVVGDVRISGGSTNSTIPNIASSAGAPGAGGPAGLPSHTTQDGAQPGWINPTQGKFRGSGGGSGNLDEGAGLPGVGSRTAAGAGGGVGASAGGAGGIITGAAAASSSLLLPSITHPAAADGIIADTNFLFGAGDFTIEIWYQQAYQSNNPGALIGVGDIGTNQRSWVFGFTNGAGNPNLWRSTDGITWIPTPGPSGSGQVASNQDLQAQYNSGGFYFGPDNVYMAWCQFVATREAGQLRFFQNGFPMVWLAGGGHAFWYAADDFDTYFPSTAPLTIGCVLNNGAVNTVDEFGQGITLNSAGWFGQARITIGAALYTCPAFSDDPAGIGQAFVPPSLPVVGGDFNCNWPGVKGATATVAIGANLTFVGAAQIDSDQYCYPPAVPETGGVGVAGTDGNLWGGVGPGGGGGGGGGDLSRYRMLTGGGGGKGGKYGAGGGQGGGVNSGVYNTMGDPAAAPGLGGLGEGGVLVFEYEAAAAGDSRAFMLGIS